MSESHSAYNAAYYTYIGSVLIEIDTLNWVFNEASFFGLEATS
jgi:hypothetical protein